jgi:hypothetical protein
MAKYTKEADEKKDKGLLKKAGFDKEQKEEFEKKDEAHGKKKKPKTLEEDRAIDKKIIKGIKKKKTAHEKKENEKAKEKREKK